MKGKSPARPRKPTSSPPLLEALKELPQPLAAWVLGITPRGLREIPDAPRTPAGRFDIRRLVEWWLLSKGAAGSSNLERLRLAKAIEAERDNAVKSGELVRVEDVRMEVRAVARVFKLTMQPLADSHPGFREQWREAVELVWRRTLAVFAGDKETWESSSSGCFSEKPPLGGEQSPARVAAAGPSGEDSKP